ncbi:MAG: heme-copper oxidase subunit III [Chloroflexi bacterium]|nr:heme-copper oxidase subunit III [Chloroflexota bacterium]
MTQVLGEDIESIAPEVQGSHWPIVLAIALTLVLVGLTTVLVISLAGLALALVALVAWVAQRFQGPSLVDHAPASVLNGASQGAGEAVFEAPLEVFTIQSSRWGLVWFIASEAIFFANLIAAYLYLRVSSQTWPPAGGPHLDLLFPSVNTAILLLSGIPAYYAHRAIKRGDIRGLRIGLVLAALLGAVFLVGQGYEYLTAGFTIRTNVFTAAFFTLTGFHGAHVAAGIGILLTVFLLSLRGRFSAQRNFAVEVASTYWHFVDIVWIVLFTILYLAQ